MNGFRATGDYDPITSRDEIINDLHAELRAAYVMLGRIQGAVLVAEDRMYSNMDDQKEAAQRIIDDCTRVTKQFEKDVNAIRTARNLSTQIKPTVVKNAYGC